MSYVNITINEKKPIKNYACFQKKISTIKNTLNIIMIKNISKSKKKKRVLESCRKEKMCKNLFLILLRFNLSINQF